MNWFIFGITSLCLLFAIDTICTVFFIILDKTTLIPSILGGIILVSIPTILGFLSLIYYNRPIKTVPIINKSNGPSTLP